MSIDTPARTASNPLAQAVDAFPAGIAVWISVGARVIGAALALYIAAGQSYDRTQVFCAFIAAAALASLPPITRMAPFFAGFGAGILFFAGALLWAQAAGMAMLVAGAIAIVATLVDTHHHTGDIGRPIGAFLFGLGATVAAVAAIILTIEG